MITYSDEDVAFEEIDSAKAILISNDGTILHSNFVDDPAKAEKYLNDFHTIYPTVCYLRSLDQMKDGI